VYENRAILPYDSLSYKGHGHSAVFTLETDYPVYHLRLLLTQTYFYYSPWRVKQIRTLL